MIFTVPQSQISQTIEFGEGTSASQTPTEKKRPKSLPSFLRDLDRKKIQSNTKNIENLSQIHFVYDKNIITIPSLPQKYSKEVQELSKIATDNRNIVKLPHSHLHQHQHRQEGHQINSKKFSR